MVFPELHKVSLVLEITLICSFLSKNYQKPIAAGCLWLLHNWWTTWNNNDNIGMKYEVLWFKKHAQFDYQLSIGLFFGFHSDYYCNPKLPFRNLALFPGKSHSQCIVWNKCIFNLFHVANSSFVHIWGFAASGRVCRLLAHAFHLPLLESNIYGFHINKMWKKNILSKCEKLILVFS